MSINDDFEKWLVKRHGADNARFLLDYVDVKVVELREVYHAATKRAVEKCRVIEKESESLLDDAKETDALFEIRLIHSAAADTVHCCIAAIQGDTDGHD